MPEPDECDVIASDEFLDAISDGRRPAVRDHADALLANYLSRWRKHLRDQG